MRFPELPEGYFWRVHSDSFGFMMVDLRRKTWLGSRKEETGYVLEKPPVPSAIEEAARWALRKFNIRDQKRAFLDEFRTFEGDYCKED